MDKPTMEQRINQDLYTNHTLCSMLTEVLKAKNRQEWGLYVNLLSNYIDIVKTYYRR